MQFSNDMDGYNFIHWYKPKIQCRGGSRICEKGGGGGAWIQIPRCRARKKQKSAEKGGGGRGRFGPLLDPPLQCTMFSIKELRVILIQYRAANSQHARIGSVSRGPGLSLYIQRCNHDRSATQNLTPISRCFISFSFHFILFQHGKLTSAVAVFQ